jgi:hypothetical protein
MVAIGQEEDTSIFEDSGQEDHQLKNYALIQHDPYDSSDDEIKIVHLSSIRVGQEHSSAGRRLDLSGSHHITRQDTRT